jgi:hypothetical protein
MRGEYIKLVESVLREAEQEFSSEKTSRPQVSALHKYLLKKNIPQPNTLVLDWGGGKFNLTKELYESSIEGMQFLVYDKFNRNSQHNNEMLNVVRQHGGCDLATCANMFNVIKEKEIRLESLNSIKTNMKSGAMLYITVYKAPQSSAYQETEEFVGQQTSDGWQNAQPIDFYLPEVQQVFGNGSIKAKVISVKK